jgi:flagellar basal body-associated protein FliL
MSKAKKRNFIIKSNSILRWIIIIVLVIGVAIATFFGVNAAYNKGVQTGREDYEKETTELLSNLGTAISEKTNFNQNAKNILKDVPAEINEEGIDTYINNLITLADTTKTEEIKNIINEYIVKWQSFKDVYLSEDNDAISEAFNNLKTEAGSTATKIREAFDAKISDALNNL